MEYARTAGDFADRGGRRRPRARARRGRGPRRRPRRPTPSTALLDGATAEQAARLAGRTVTDPHQRALVTELTRRALNEAGRA